MSDRSLRADVAASLPVTGETPAAPSLRARLAAEFQRIDAHDCGYDHGFCADPDADPETAAFVDAAVKLVQGELDRLTSERDAADRTLLDQPILRHCVLPGCLREFDAKSGLTGQPVRESWSGKGWLMLPSLHSHICPEHAWLVADDAHRPNWDRTSDQTVLACACGWRSPVVRWSGFATASWRDHLLTVTEEPSDV